MKITGKEPAYPTTPTVTSEYNQNGTIKMLQTSPAFLGMDIRTYLAGKVMQGVLASGHSTTYDVIARKSVEMADALIVELNKTEK